MVPDAPVPDPDAATPDDGAHGATTPGTGAPGAGALHGRGPAPAAPQGVAGPARGAGRGGGRSGGQPEEPSGLGPLVELEGVVEEGVELGAVVLRADAGGTWLVGAALRHLVGHRVRLRGAERLGLMTTAQQGPALAVEDVEDLGPA